MFTPKIAGSVMPINALNAEGSAMDFVLAFFVFKATARVAAPWAKFAADASGSQYVTPYWASCPTSIIVYMWCTPATTVGAYNAPITKLPIPRGRAISHWMPLIIPFSITTKTGPITEYVR